MSLEKNRPSEAIAPNAQEQEWFLDALKHLETIRQLTSAALVMSQERKTPADISQAIMQRGEVVQSLVRLLTPERIQQLDDAKKRDLDALLQGIQGMDSQATEHMGNILDRLKQQMNQLGKGKQVLRKYHLNVDEPSSIHNREA